MTDHQILSYEDIWSYSDFKVSKTLKNTGIFNTSHIMAVSKFSLLSFESVSKVVSVYERISLKIPYDKKTGFIATLKLL